MGSVDLRIGEVVKTLFSSTFEVLGLFIFLLRDNENDLSVFVCFIKSVTLVCITTKGTKMHI